MKRIAALLLCLFLLLLVPACRQKSIPTRPATVLQLAVQRGISRESAAGLDCFTNKVRELSGGEMVVETLPSDDVLDSLDRGCALILASNAEIARADSNFSSYTSPFYFYDYNHLTLTLNSERFRKIISDEALSLLGALPLAAFYDGNSVILSSGPLSFDTVDQFEGADLTISNDPILSDLLRGLGARVRIREEESQRLEGFCQGGDPAVECRISSLFALTELPDEQSFTVCRTFHRAQINWIMLSETARQTLTAREQAVLTEAAAYAIAANDRLVLSGEAQAIAAAEKLGGDESTVIFGEFFEPIAQVLRSLDRYNSIWNWEQHLEVQQLSIREESRPSARAGSALIGPLQQHLEPGASFQVLPLSQSIRKLPF